jgi:hypothetical protein
MLLSSKTVLADSIVVEGVKPLTAVCGFAFGMQSRKGQFISARGGRIAITLPFAGS